ncbi:MAG TPA: type II secretion system F family protein, partial [Kiritimatiellia bacterium]
SGFSDAWAASCGEVTPFERAVLHSGERAGTLGEVFDQLAGYLDDQHELRESVTTAMLYPMFVLGLAVVVAIAMFGFILPNLQRLFTESAMQLPWLTRMIMASSQWGLRVFLPVGIAAGACAWFAIGSIRRNPAQRERMEQMLFGWPLVGRGYKLLVNVRFAQTMSLLLRGGVGIVEAMELAGMATGSVWLGRLLKHEAGAVRDGAPLAKVLRNVPPLGGALPGWVHAGEASGHLQPLLSRAGERFQHQWRLYIKRVTAVLEPVLILIVAVIVLIVALAVLMPILQMNKAM